MWVSESDTRAARAPDSLTHKPISDRDASLIPYADRCGTTTEEGRRMDPFLQRFAGQIKGVITGFDRIVFKETIRPLTFAEGAMGFLRSRGVLNKGGSCKTPTDDTEVVPPAQKTGRFIRVLEGRAPSRPLW
jgi:hypothetical protein